VLAPINAYSPPEAPIEGPVQPVPLWVRLFAFPVLALGAVATATACYWAVGLLPHPIGPRGIRVAILLSYSALFAVCAAAPWWIPVARIYRKRALFVGAAVALAPVAVRTVLSSGPPASVFMWSVTLVETVGLVAALGLGSRAAASPLGANNSSKPTPLRGAA